MASGFFSILDDVAALMQNVVPASKVATRKTAAILGDDLAVNAERATGFLASRELPVLWSITKGSFLNKLIIVPIALLLTAFLPAAIRLILILGAFYLAYEAVEKIIEYFFHRNKSGEQVIAEQQLDHDSEKVKIKSAITTDFILSIEIAIIALGAVLEKSLPVQIITVSIVAILATVGVYGLVALVIRMDDVGYKLIKRSQNRGVLSKVGRVLVTSLPYIIKLISVVGTIALLLVSGGIFVHNIEYVHHLLPQLPEMLQELLTGLIAGAIVTVVVTGAKKLISLMR